MLSYIYLFAILAAVSSNAEMVVVRLVENPSKVSLTNDANQPINNPGQGPTSTGTVKPIIHKRTLKNQKLTQIFRNLANICSKATFDRYMYEVCLFDNVTQTDFSSSAFSATTSLLGTFQDFVVSKEGELWSLKGIRFLAGQECPGKVCREANVLFRCGTENKVVSVTEPSHCTYEIVVESSQFCASLQLKSVYGLLSTNRLRKEWDAAASRHAANFTTKLGLDREIRRLLVADGILLDRTKAEHFRRACLS